MNSVTTNFQIRDARSDEHAAIRDLTLAAYEQYGAIMAPTAWAGLSQAVQSGLASAGPVERIVAVQDGRIIGSVMLYPGDANAYGEGAVNPSWPELRLLAVAPETRGQGVGKALVEECLRRAAASGATSLGLHTSESMPVAMRIYEQAGFKRDPANDFHPEGAELVQAFRRELGS